MAKVPYVGRQATARLLTAQFNVLQRTLGLMVKAGRDYTVAEGKITQTELASRARVTQAEISNLEQGKGIPSDARLKGILSAIGFTKAEQTLLRDAFSLLRAHAATLNKLDKILG